MTSHSRIFWIILAIAIPLAGYALMHSSTYLFPLGEGQGHLAYTVILIALGLSIPLFMLKAGFHAAKLRKPDEKEFELKDIPKDKDQLAK